MRLSGEEPEEVAGADPVDVAQEGVHIICILELVSP
jgi:hypothetical protein